MLAMLIASANFIVGNRAVQDIPAFSLVFWRTSIGALCLLPFALMGRRSITTFFWQNKLKSFALVLTGVVLPPWLIYLALNSSKLVDLSVGYKSIPLMTVVFSVFLLNERLSFVQCMGLGLALIGSFVFAFHGNLTNLVNFDPHIEFLWVLAATLCGSLYLVLLKRWDMRPSPSEGLFMLFLIGTVALSPSFIYHAATDLHPMNYSLELWGSVLFVGIGAGGVYFLLIGFGINRLGATKTSLLTLIIPVLVTAESMLFLEASLHVYQGVGGALVLAGVYLVAHASQTSGTKSHSIEMLPTTPAMKVATE